MKHLYRALFVILISSVVGCSPNTPAISQSLPEASTSPVACSVTIPRRVENVRGTQTYAPSFVIGNERLWTFVEASNITQAQPHQIQENGIMVIKWPWLYKADVSGDLSVRGHLVDSTGASSEWYTLATDIAATKSDDLEPGTEASVSYMNFPFQGCWQITAAKGSEHFTFTTEVRQAQQ